MGMTQHVRAAFFVEKDEKGTLAAVIAPELRFVFIANKIGRTIFGAKVELIRTSRRR